MSGQKVDGRNRFQKNDELLLGMCAASLGICCSDVSLVLDYGGNFELFNSP